VDDTFALLDIDRLDHPAAARRDLDDAALDIGLAVGDGRIGAVDLLGRSLLLLGLFRSRALLHGHEADAEHDDQHQADPEPLVLEETGHFSEVLEDRSSASREWRW